MGSPKAQKLKGELRASGGRRRRNNYVLLLSLCPASWLAANRVAALGEWKTGANPLRFGAQLSGPKAAKNAGGRGPANTSDK